MSAGSGVGLTAPAPSCRRKMLTVPAGLGGLGQNNHVEPWTTFAATRVPGTRSHTVASCRSNGPGGNGVPSTGAQSVQVAVGPPLALAQGSAVDDRPEIDGLPVGGHCGEMRPGRRREARDRHVRSIHAVAVGVDLGVLVDHPVVIDREHGARVALVEHRDRCPRRQGVAERRPAAFAEERRRLLRDVLRREGDDQLSA